MAECRELATQLPRTALTVMARSRPATTNTIIISMNVNPATCVRRGIEDLSTDASPSVDLLPTAVHGQSACPPACLTNRTRSPSGQRQVAMHRDKYHNASWYNI